MPTGAVEMEGTLLDGDCSGTGLSSLGDNLESPGDTCSLDHASDLPNQPDAMLLPLAGYGGPTPTHALRPASPAVNEGVTCASVDQRNFPRPRVLGCEIGAFELGAPTVEQWIFADGFESQSCAAWSQGTN